MLVTQRPKVGKEQVVGLLVALERYVANDHEADLALWRKRCERVSGALATELKNLDISIQQGTFDTEIYVPQVVIRLGSPEAASSVSAALHNRTPSVHCYEGALWDGSLIISPSTIRDEEEGPLIQALVDEITALGDRQETES